MSKQMEAKQKQVAHTPGPWTRSGGSIVGPDGRSIWNPQRGWGEVSANYDLVCRAPSMEAEIERLRRIVQFTADYFEGEESTLGDEARAALEVRDA